MGMLRGDFSKSKVCSMYMEDVEEINENASQRTMMSNESIWKTVS